MKYGFINSLSESRLFPTQTSLERYTVQDIASLVAIHLSALQILTHDPKAQDWIRGQLERIVQYTDFSKWRLAAGDLYVLLNALHTINQNSPYRYRLDEDLVMRWLRYLYRGQRSAAHALMTQIFVRLDYDLNIQDSNLRAIRRLVMAWDEIEVIDRRLAVTRLLQFLRRFAPRSEFIEPMEAFAKRRDLEIQGAKDPTALHGNLDSSRIRFNPKWFEPHTVREDDGGTSAADIASLPSVLGGVIRRPK